MTVYDLFGNPVTADGAGLFQETDTLPNGYLLPKFPTALYDKTDTHYKWTDYNNDLANAVGSAAYIYMGRLFEGTVYVRGLSNSPYANGTYRMFAVDSDFLAQLAGDAAPLDAEYVRRNFNGNYVGVFADGTHTTTGGSDGVEGCYGYVVLQKFEIPKGKHGVLVTGITGDTLNASMYGWLAGWNAVFTIDPTDTITKIPSGESLKAVCAVNEEGFAAGFVNNPHTAQYLREHAGEIAPAWAKPHTFGKSVYLAGDSNHQYFGGNGFTNAGFISDWNRHLGFRTVVNAGYAGSTWYGTTGGGGIKRVTDLVAAGVPYDVISLAWGTNDADDRYGAIEDDPDNAEDATMVAAMKWCITQLRAAFPKTGICVICPPPQFGTAGDAASELMVEVCKELHVPYVDMRRHISMDDMGVDEIHLGVGGISKYGAAQAALISEVCPWGDPLTAE